MNKFEEFLSEVSELAKQKNIKCALFIFDPNNESETKPQDTEKESNRISYTHNFKELHYFLRSKLPNSTLTYQSSLNSKQEWPQYIIQKSHSNTKDTYDIYKRSLLEDPMMKEVATITFTDYGYIIVESGIVSSSFNKEFSIFMSMTNDWLLYNCTSEFSKFLVAISNYLEKGEYDESHESLSANGTNESNGL